MQVTGVIQSPFGSSTKLWLRSTLLATAVLMTLAACKEEKGLIKASKSQAAENRHRTTQVQSGDFTVSVSATGKVAPLREVEVLSKASGEVIELPYQTGDLVKKGDLLARIDPDDERRHVQRSEAALLSAKARLEKARRELDLTRSSSKKSVADAEAALKAAEARLTDAESKCRRQEELFKQSLVARETVESSQTALEQARTDRDRAQAALEDTRSMPHQIASREQDIRLAEAEVANAQIALEEARERLVDTEILSPMDGVITERKIEAGQVISSPFANVGGGTKLMVVSDLSTLYLVTSVDEADIGGIEVGQNAVITADAFPGERFAGRVDHIAPVGVAVSTVVTFDVKVAVVGDGSRRLRPGMTADVSVILGESPNTLWVQTEAIQGPSEEPYVERLLADGKTQKIPVELGMSDGLRIEVRQGLEAGQEVLLHDLEGKSAWERGEGAYRPMRGSMNPLFGRRRR